MPAERVAISESEFRVSRLKLLVPAQQRFCVSGQALMAAYDTDGGGTLSAEELQRMGAQGGRIFMADGDVRPNDSLRDTSDFRQLRRLRKS